MCPGCVAPRKPRNLIRVLTGRTSIVEAMDIHEIRTQLAHLDARRGSIDAEYDAAFASKDGKRIAKLDAEFASFDVKERSLRRQLARAEQAVADEIDARRVAMHQAAKALALEKMGELRPLV